MGGAPEQEQLSQAHMPRLDRPSAGSGSSSGGVTTYNEFGSSRSSNSSNTHLNNTYHSSTKFENTVVYDDL